MSFQANSTGSGGTPPAAGMLAADASATLTPTVEAVTAPGSTQLPEAAEIQAPASPRHLGEALRLSLQPARRTWSEATAGPFARFHSLASGLRWGALAVALAMGAIQGPTRAMWLFGASIFAYSLVQTVWPVPYEGSRLRILGPPLLEVSLLAATVEFTGLGRSPFLLSLAVATLIAGSVGGLRIVPGLVTIAFLSVAVPGFALVQDRANATEGVQFGTLLLLVGLMGGYSRHLVEDAGRVGQGLVDQMQQLTEVNDLLFDLHAATERVPMPLELDGAVSWVLERADEAFSPDVAAVILRDPLTEQWKVAAGSGLRAGMVGSVIEMTSVLAVAARGDVVVPLERRDRGLDYSSTWGMYAPLKARQEVIGLLAVESETRRENAKGDDRRLGGLASAASLAIDNARWLERIHSFGVEQERSRLARDLHDHVGQSMMYLGFELDRLVQVNHGRAVAGDLLTLRRDVKTLIQDLRDTLVDLRTDVSADRDVSAVLEALASRVNHRGRVKVKCSFDVEHRLAVPVEREVWRVAQEAVVNAERHARASHVEIMWLCHRRVALLEVVDDGIGLPVGAPTNQGSYGLMGMRERAHAIGAQLDIGSQPGKGTTVRLRLEVP